MPSAAALRRMAPTLVWSTMSSSTRTVRAPSRTSSTLGRGLRCSEASAPRWTWKPVTSSASASETTKQGASVGVEYVAEPAEPARRHQERAGGIACLDGATHHLLALGQEQAVLGLEVLAQLDVAQVAVVGEPRVVGVVDLDQLGHGPLPG